MATLEIDGDDLVLRLRRWERLGALSGDVRVPLSAVTAVQVAADPFKAITGIRAPGTGLPGVVALGRWRSRKAVDFVAVHRGEPALVVELTGAAFRRLVVSTPQAETIALAISARGSAQPD